MSGDAIFSATGNPSSIAADTASRAVEDSRSSTIGRPASPRIRFAACSPMGAAGSGAGAGAVSATGGV